MGEEIKLSKTNGVLNKEDAPQKINILVVDDEEVIRSFLHTVLVDCGYNVEVVSSAEEALEKIKTVSFDIAMTDLKMPGMGGVGLMKKLREMNSDISIIVMTGYPSMETALEALRQGAYDYITKPFNLPDLKSVISRAVENQAFLRERRKLPIQDDLTDIYNQRYFFEIFSREISRNERYSHHLVLLLLDIDNFKAYNDIYGHSAGDEVLKQSACLFTKSIRRVDFVFRYGGDEFVIILPETNKQGALHVSSRVSNLFEKATFNVDKSALDHLTISIGIAVYPDDALTEKELMLKADQALYQAKQLKKNKICFFEMHKIKTIDETVEN